MTVSQSETVGGTEPVAEVLWLVPDKPDNISTGRSRIAQGLRERGYAITLTDDKTGCIVDVHGYDVFITTTVAGGLAAPIAKRNGTRVIVDYVDPISQLYDRDGPTIGLIGSELLRTAFRVSDATLYVYDRERTRVNQYDSKAFKTTLGVDFDRFHNPSASVVRRAEQVLNQYDIQSGFAVYIGGFEPIYNIETMLEGAVRSESDLVVAGAGSQADVVERYADRYETIHALGLVDHEIIPGILSKASVGISLVDDPHTVKVLEYAASGLGVVHVDGQATAELPETTTVTQNTPGSVAQAIDNTNRDDTGPTVEYARKHDYGSIVTDYETAIKHTLDS